MRGNLSVKTSDGQHFTLPEKTWTEFKTIVLMTEDIGVGEDIFLPPHISGDTFSVLVTLESGVKLPASNDVYFNVFEAATFLDYQRAIDWLQVGLVERVVACGYERRSLRVYYDTAIYCVANDKCLLQQFTKFYMSQELLALIETFGMSTITYAAFTNNLKALELLLRLGVIPEDTAFNCACTRGHLQIVRRLLKDDRVNVSYGIVCASRSGQLRVIEVLLQSDRVDLPLPLTCLALEVATKNGHVQIVQALLNNRWVRERLSERLSEEQMTLESILKYYSK